MKNPLIMSALLISIPFAFTHAETTAVNQLLQDYKNQGIGVVDSQQGKALWQQEFNVKNNEIKRSCTNCHTDNLSKTGRHIKTNKAIKPMSPVSNSKRLTDIKKIKKWLKRNCKWTMGRECSTQEKANILSYLTNANIK